MHKMLTAAAAALMAACGAGPALAGSHGSWGGGGHGWSGGHGFHGSFGHGFGHGIGRVAHFAWRGARWYGGPWALGADLLDYALSGALSGDRRHGDEDYGPPPPPPPQPRYDYGYYAPYYTCTSWRWNHYVGRYVMVRHAC